MRKLPQISMQTARVEGRRNQDVLCHKNLDAEKTSLEFLRDINTLHGFVALLDHMTLGGRRFCVFKGRLTMGVGSRMSKEEKKMRG